MGEQHGFSNIDLEAPVPDQMEDDSIFDQGGNGEGGAEWED